MPHWPNGVEPANFHPSRIATITRWQSSTRLLTQPGYLRKPPKRIISSTRRGLATSSKAAAASTPHSFEPTTTTRDRLIEVTRAQRSRVGRQAGTLALLTSGLGTCHGWALLVLNEI